MDVLNEIPPPIPVPPPTLGEPKYPMMETRMFKGKPVYVTTIPRGTLLFRGVTSTHDRKADFYGVKQRDGSYFLPKQYEVFFYPFPFVDQSVVGDYPYTAVSLFILTKNVKLVTLISPSPYIRGHKNNGKHPALTTCDRIDFKPLRGRDYDPCFSPDFLNENPDIGGMIAIASKDKEAFHEWLDTQGTDTAKYFSSYEDNSKWSSPIGYTGGIPEIILYPLDGRRQHMNLNVPSDPLQELAFRGEKFVYTEFFTFPHPSNHPEFKRAIKTLLGAKNPQGKHTYQLDKTTGFLVLRLMYITDPSNSLSNLTDLTDINISEQFPELRFVHADIPEIYDDEEAYDEEGYYDEGEGGAKQRRKTLKRKTTTKRRKTYRKK